jgi:methyl-accepting chemotaxis protein
MDYAPKNKLTRSTQYSITKKMITSVLGAVIIMNLAMLGFIGIQTSKKANKIADEVAIHRSESIAMDVKNYVDQAMETTSTLATTLNALKSSENGTREDISEILINVLKSSDEYLALWTLWEANAFDAKDAMYSDHPDYQESEGRFNLSFFKNGKTIEQEMGDIGDYQEDYYMTPKTQGTKSVIDPYHYSFNNNQEDKIFMTSIVVPIFDEKKFLGVVGLDISLEHLSNMVEGAQLYESGKASVVSHNLQIAAHEDRSLLGTDLSAQIRAEKDQSLASIQKGEQYIIRDKKIDNVLRTFTPLHFRGVEKPWSVIAEIPIKEVNAQLRALLIFMALIGLIGIAFISLVVFVISGKITRPILRTIASVEEVAMGNLDAEILFTERKDEIGQLANSLKTLTEKLKEILGGVLTGANNVASASQQMLSTSHQMSEGSTEQATSAEEVSSSMEEMVANIRQTTDNAMETENIAKKVLSGIEQVGNRAQESFQSVKGIATKITIITEIARQTNMLALNAAVEAARAGEHGKGFAVVAAEVRKLAETTKLAAAEIGTMAMNSLAVTEKAGELMNELIPEIKKTTQLIQEVTAASIEQNSGAEQVNSAIQQLNAVTQQNASASEELSASSEELTKQADHLLEMISYFKGNATPRKSKMRDTTSTTKLPKNGWLKAENIVLTPLKKGFNIDLGDNYDSGYERF